MAAAKGRPERRPIAPNVKHRVDGAEQCKHWQEETEVERTQREVVPRHLARKEAATSQVEEGRPSEEDRCPGE